MTIPRDAVVLEDFKRMERGLPPRPKPQPKREEPVPPVVKDQVVFETIPEGKIIDFDARAKSYKNKDGAIFCGYIFRVEFEGGKEISGWLPEGEFFQLKRRIPKERTDLIGRIGL